MSFVGNNGTFIMGYKAMVMDVEFLYHLAYVLTSTLGLFVHELFYSILVRLHSQKNTQTHTCILHLKINVYLDQFVSQKAKSSHGCNQKNYKTSLPVFLFKENKD